MIKLIPIHPFPARMAPEIVFEELEGLTARRTILDPMSGSGTVLRAASELGHRAIGFDLDPLAVLMARVWTTSCKIESLQDTATEIVRKAKRVKGEYLPWIDDCEETNDYVKFWFGNKQIRALRRLTSILASMRGRLADVMKITLSRIIITKERGASLARDTSHSRPHRVFFGNDYDVYEGFLQSTERLAAKLMVDKLLGSVTVQRGDARMLNSIPSKSIDAVITSPPYLNAIDYLRGHRLSLVWLGFKVSDIRALRSQSIGAESSADDKIPSSLLDELLSQAGAIPDLPSREIGMVRRYAQDVYRFLRELARVTKRGGRVLLVVGNSCLKGVPVWNADINLAAAAMLGFDPIKRSERALPISHRYLPLPSDDRSGSLARRIRTETLLNLKVR
jgi:tRNA G10  N-methylase Trm11